MTTNESITAIASVGQEIRITEVEPFLLHVPVTGAHIADSMHRVTHWGVCGVVLHTDAGLRGYGYTGTHAHRECDQLITDCIARVYSPLLRGESIHDVQRLWQKLYRFPPAQWVGRAGITQLGFGRGGHRALGLEGEGMWSAAVAPVRRSQAGRHCRPTTPTADG